jgi:phospholipid/cholesterol/gamma-HCH transport system substrate-binding protein
MERTTIDMWFGAFVIAGFAALAVLAFKVGNLGAERATKTYRVEARFDNIGGLKPRSPVRTAGVTVGRVEAISLDPKDFRGIVKMEIERRYQYPKDSSAKILTSGLLGDQYIGLDPGGDDKNIQPGEAVAQTQSAVVLENLIGQFLSSKAEAPPAPPATPSASNAASGATR